MLSGFSAVFFLAGLTVPLGFLRGLVSLEGIEGDESSGSVIASALAGRFNLGLRLASDLDVGFFFELGLFIAAVGSPWPSSFSGSAA